MLREVQSSGFSCCVFSLAFPALLMSFRCHFEWTRWVVSENLWNAAAFQKHHFVFARSLWW